MRNISFIINNLNKEENKEEFLRALNSVRELVLPGDEIIVVDDSGSIIDGYYDPTDYRLLANNTNKGLMFSRSVGVNAAKNEYIMFLDADDYYVNQPKFNKVRETLVLNAITLIEQEGSQYFTTRGSHDNDERVLLSYLTAVSRASLAMKVFPKWLLVRAYNIVGDEYINQQEDYLVMNLILLNNPSIRIIDPDWKGYHYSSPAMSGRRKRTEEEINEIRRQGELVCGILSSVTDNELYRSLIKNRTSRWINALIG